MELVLEGGDDPEVAPAAAQSPEQVCVLGGTGCEHPTIGRDNLGGAEVVTSKAILAAQPAQAAATTATAVPRPLRAPVSVIPA